MFTSDAGDELVVFRSDLDIDGDGSGGNVDNDPTWQGDTTLHYEGKALNAQTEAFVVVPPLVCERTQGKVLGALCLVENVYNGFMCFAVVGDIGPSSKSGEASPAVARQLKVNPNAVHGGEARRIFRYSIFVNQPAIVNGRTYHLQSYGRA